jgi:uncharacterized membrane protein HdeD (DUF308 family)
VSQPIASRRSVPSSSTWLRNYYFVRFAVAAAWVVLAFTVGRTMPALAAILLVAYPAWDALANLFDANRNGGIVRNSSQLVNAVASTLTAAAVAAALGWRMNAVLAVFGVWAVISGLLQLATAARRWKSVGAQWAMILSGAQSALAGVFFVVMANRAATVGIADVAPYAAFGSFYFLISALWLTVLGARRSVRPGAA